MSWSTRGAEDCREGDVVEFDRFDWVKNNLNQFVGVAGPMRDDKYRYVTPVLGKPPGHDGPLYFGGHDDRWRVLPPETWSDELCVVMAVFRMTEGSDDGD